MPSQFSAYFVTKDEYLQHLRTRTLYQPIYKSNLQVGIHREFDAYSFLCRLYLDNGNGFFRILMENDKRTVSPLIEYFEKGKEFFITANGVTFYKTLDVRTDSDGYLEVAMRMVTDSVYTEKNHFFMIMPFRYDELNMFYRQHVREFLLKRLGVSIYRSDDFNDSDVIIDTIFREIEKSEFVICDITNCNKNVFFEIGYAKAIHKQMIFLIKKGADHGFFDVAHIRRIEYEIDNPVNMQERLVDTIETIRKKR